MDEFVSDRAEAICWAQDLVKNDNWCVLDTETTGLHTEAEICQIGVVDSTGKVLLNNLVKPTVPISPESTKIHGIFDGAVQMSLSFPETLIPLLKAVGKKDVIIYNAEFDLRLMKQSVRSHGIQLAFPTSDRRGCRIFLNGGSIICAMKKYSQFVGEWNDYYGDYKWQRLPAGDHSAVGDCQAVIKLIHEMASAEIF